MQDSISFDESLQGSAENKQDPQLPTHTDDADTMLKIFGPDALALRDKSTRCEPPVAEAGNVHVLPGDPWPPQDRTLHQHHACVQAANANF